MHNRCKISIGMNEFKILLFLRKESFKNKKVYIRKIRFIANPYYFLEKAEKINAITITRKGTYHYAKLTPFGLELANIIEKEMRRKRDEENGIY